MVNKKIKTKLVLDRNGQSTNPPAGCCVDHTITGQNTFDFYIVCTESRFGVPTPTHFTVLVNEL
jgi:hypothetical protein